MKTKPVAKWADLPRRPAVYAFYGDERPRGSVTQVGSAGDLRGRLHQHFSKENSVATDTHTAGIELEQVRRVRWWEHPLFEDEDRRHAAEVVAFHSLAPLVRSRASVRREAVGLKVDPQFRSEMERRFRDAPTGEMIVPRLWDLWEQVTELTERLARMETRLFEVSTREGTLRNVESMGSAAAAPEPVLAGRGR